MRDGALVQKVPRYNEETEIISSISHLRIAWDNSNFFFVWDDNRTGNRYIYGKQVTSDGTVIDPDGFPITTHLDNQTYPNIVWDGSSFVVIWSYFRSS